MLKCPRRQQTKRHGLNARKTTFRCGAFGPGCRLPDAAGYIKRVESQFDFSVDVIETNITDHNLIKLAVWKEVAHRLERYRTECLAGDEKLTTVKRIATIAGGCAMHLARPQFQRDSGELTNAATPSPKLESF